MNKLSPTDSPGSLIGAPVGPYQADMHLEAALKRSGHDIIAGIDEAGRGPLAGPVVAAAVILDANNIPEGLGDSKTLSSMKRNNLYIEILRCSEVSIATISAKLIDQINIRQATLLCMSRAVNALNTRADWCIIDGKDLPDDLAGRATAVIKGDGRSSSIAAASIIAKVTRDAIMIESANTYPDYGFEQHKGYGTQFHRDAITEHGPCAIHRFSFAPIRNM
ncbi:MAG: ribonuclease HII [Hyphomicrobiales bacterium]|nr:ribonuclease HII [Hyphomicrobiales bacterium]